MPTLSRAAWRYLAHAALLTFGLALSSLFFNLALIELGYDRRTVALPLVGSISLLGLLNSLPVALAALSSLPLWWLVGRVGPRVAMVAGALLHAVGLGTIALSPEPVPLLIGALLGGPASVLFQVSAAPYMMRHSGDRERDTLFSLSAGLNVGVAGLGALLGGFVPGLAATLLELAPQSAAAYRATFAVAAMFTALAALPLLVREHRTKEQRNKGTRLPHPRSPTSNPDPRSLRALLHMALPALRFVVSPLLISCGAALLIPFLNVYFRQRFGAPDVTLGVIFAAISVVTGVATLGAPLLSARLGKMGSVVLTQSLAIPCLLLLGAAPVLPLAVLIALARGALMNMASPLYDAYAMERSPEAARPMVIGLINGAFSAGYIVGPNISVAVQASYGFGPLFVATAVCYSLAACANYLLFLRPRQPRPAASGSDIPPA